MAKEPAKKTTLPRLSANTLKVVRKPLDLLSKNHNYEDMVGLLAHLEPKKVLLLGDLILDAYTYGKVGRISPEAPVPVLLVEKEEQLPGGAGNVALNLAGLGNEVILCSRVGEDAAGRMLRQTLQIRGQGKIHTHDLIEQKGLDTPVKTRFMAASQQLLRVDREKASHPLDLFTRKELIKRALASIEKVDIVAVSDYGKGAIDRELLDPIFKRAQKLGIPIVVDPKAKDLTLYEGATLIKPNLKEALEAAALGSESSLDQVAKAIMMRFNSLPFLMITRSGDGISLFEKGKGRLDFPARAFDIVDVTGAGDCVLAALVHGMASGLALAACCHMANIAGALAVQRMGCAQLSLSHLARQMLRMDTHCKIFDESHLFALKEACKHEKVHLISLKSKKIDVEFLLELSHYKSANPKVMIIVQMPRVEVSSPELELLIKATSVDMVVLLDHQNCHLAVGPEASLVWQKGKFIPLIPKV